MADLIDRQELLKHKGNCYDEEGHLLYAVGTGTILLMPTVDAVEVVRCKDCIHYWNNAKNDEATFVTVCLASPKEDAYCSEGERKEDAKIN